MHEIFILIPSRTSKQGTSLNESKFGEAYRVETTTVQMNPDDMKRLGVTSGDRVRLTSEFGTSEVVVQAAKANELPTGLLFMAYGDGSSKLMGGDTHGTGMPSSKGIDVTVEKLPESI